VAIGVPPGQQRRVLPRDVMRTPGGGPAICLALTLLAHGSAGPGIAQKQERFDERIGVSPISQPTVGKRYGPAAATDTWKSPERRRPDRTLRFGNRNLAC